jgi:hypothetical protein
MCRPDGSKRREYDGRQNSWLPEGHGVLSSTEISDLATIDRPHPTPSTPIQTGLVCNVSCHVNRASQDPPGAQIVVGRQAVHDISQTLPRSARSSAQRSRVDIAHQPVGTGRQPARPVNNAFNNITWYSLANKSAPKGTQALSVAEDPLAASQTVLGLVDELGFDPIDAGGLAHSWRHQPRPPCYCHDVDAARIGRRWPTPIARASRSIAKRPTHWRGRI